MIRGESLHVVCQRVGNIRRIIVQGRAVHYSYMNKPTLNGDRKLSYKLNFSEIKVAVI